MAPPKTNPVMASHRLPAHLRPPSLRLYAGSLLAVKPDDLTHIRNALERIANALEVISVYLEPKSYKKQPPEAPEAQERLPLGEEG